MISPHALALIASLVWIAGCAAHFEAETAGDKVAIGIKTLAAPGAFELRNEGSAEVSLLRSLAVEKKSGEKWEPAPVTLQLIESCAEKPASECITLAPRAVFRPVPWNGYSCGGQCPEPCRANVYLGPGTFRVVATTCDRKHHFPSPAFTLPAAPG